MKRRDSKTQSLSDHRPTENDDGEITELELDELTFVAGGQVMLTNCYRNAE